jgi:flagellar biosynthesis chaperone FliJ
MPLGESLKQKAEALCTRAAEFVVQITKNITEITTVVTAATAFTLMPPAPVTAQDAEKNGDGKAEATTPADVDSTPAAAVDGGDDPKEGPPELSALQQATQFRNAGIQAVIDGDMEKAAEYFSETIRLCTELINVPEEQKSDTLEHFREHVGAHVILSELHYRLKNTLEMEKYEKQVHTLLDAMQFEVGDTKQRLNELIAGAEVPVANILFWLQGEYDDMQSAISSQGKGLDSGSFLHLQEFLSTQQEIERQIVQMRMWDAQMSVDWGEIKWATYQWQAVAHSQAAPAQLRFHAELSLGQVADEEQDYTEATTRYLNAGEHTNYRSDPLNSDMERCFAELDPQEKPAFALRAVSQLEGELSYLRRQNNPEAVLGFLDKLQARAEHFTTLLDAEDPEMKQVNTRLKVLSARIQLTRERLTPPVEEPEPEAVGDEQAPSKVECVRRPLREKIRGAFQRRRANRFQRN